MQLLAGRLLHPSSLAAAVTVHSAVHRHHQQWKLHERQRTQRQPPISSSTGATHNEVLSSTEDTLDAAPDDDSAFSLWAGGGGVREEDGGVGALHDALDIGAVAADDEQVVLGCYLQVHVDHQAGLRVRRAIRTSLVTRDETIHNASSKQSPVRQDRQIQ